MSAFFVMVFSCFYGFIVAQVTSTFSVLYGLIVVQVTSAFLFLSFDCGGRDK